MAKKRIQLPEEIKQLDGVVEECIKAESTPDDDLNAESVLKARKKASDLAKVLAVADLAYDSYLVFQVYTFFKTGDILSALNVLFATLLPRVISKTKERFAKKDSGQPQLTDKSSGSDPP